MDGAFIADRMKAEQDQRISEAVDQEWSRLRGFIRRRVTDPGEVEDILQDVFYELVLAFRMMKPIERVGAWLYRVAQNRITDHFRKKRPQALEDPAMIAEDGDALRLQDLLPSPDAGPEAEYARTVLLDELEDALDELPEDQRLVFLAHEVEGLSFKELAERTGVNVNTLLSRKSYAVRALRRRLQFIYDDFNRG